MEGREQVPHEALRKVGAGLGLVTDHSVSLDAACAIPLCAISGATFDGVSVDYVITADASAGHLIADH